MPEAPGHYEPTRNDGIPSNVPDVNIHVVAFQSPFLIGEMVYLRHDPDQLPRMVTAITLNPGGVVLYDLTLAEVTVACTALEITHNRDFAKSR